MKIFDLRATIGASPKHASSFASQPAAAAPALTIPASVGGGELLSLDWNKYEQFTLAAAGTDKRIQIWDCRMMKASAGAEGPVVGANCTGDLLGHEYAVRKVQWSPHRADVLASASYDMTCRMCVIGSASVPLLLI